MVSAKMKIFALSSRPGFYGVSDLMFAITLRWNEEILSMHETHRHHVGRPPDYEKMEHVGGCSCPVVRWETNVAE